MTKFTAEEIESFAEGGWTANASGATIVHGQYRIQLYPDCEYRILLNEVVIASDVHSSVKLAALRAQQRLKELIDKNLGERYTLQAGRAVYINGQFAFNVTPVGAQESCLTPEQKDKYAVLVVKLLNMYEQMQSF